MAFAEQQDGAGSLARHVPALLAALLIAAALAAFLFLPLRKPAEVRQPVRLQIGTTLIDIDARYLRRGPQRSGGLLERADLMVQWPDFGPAELVVRDRDGNPAPARPLEHVLISLRAADGPDPARHAVNLYGRFVDADAWTIGHGLVMRRFKSTSPYQDEELYIAAPDGEEFTARCPRQDISGATHGRCIAQFRVGALDMSVNFEPALLGDWQLLRTGLIAFVTRSLR